MRKVRQKREAAARCRFFVDPWGRTCDATPKFGEALGYKGWTGTAAHDGGREWMSASETGINL